MADMLPAADDEFQRKLAEIDAATGVAPAMGTPSALGVGRAPSVPISQMVASINARPDAAPMPQVTEPAFNASALEPMQQSTGAFVAPTMPQEQPAAAPQFPVFKADTSRLDALSRESRIASGTSKTAIEEAAKASERQRLAGIDAVRAEQESAQIQAEAEQRKVEAQLAADQEAQAKQLALREAANKQAAETQAKIDEQNRIYREGKIDPTRMWANMATPNKILAGISMALGALGAAMTGRGSNIAVEVIQKAIDDDVQLQKEQLDRARQAGVELRTQLGDYEKITGNNAAAIELTKAQRYTAAAQQLASESAKLKSPQLRAEAQAKIADIEALAAEANARAAALNSENARANINSQLQIEELRQRAQGQAQAATVEAMKAAPQGADPTAPDAQIVGATFSRPLSKEQLKKAEEAVDANNILRDAIDRVLEKRRKMGATFDVKGLLDQEGAYLSNAVKQQLIKAGAAESEAEARTKQVLQGFEDASDWSSVDARLENLRSIADTASNSVLKSMGGRLNNAPKQFGQER